MLNPEINSLSPSAKSKGARFVSARHIISQINRTGKKYNTAKKKLKDIKILRLVEEALTKKTNKTTARLISYEILCEEARTPPTLANLDHLLHPVNRVKKTPQPKKIIKAIKGNCVCKRTNFSGNKTQRVNIKKNLAAGKIK